MRRVGLIAFAVLVLTLGPLSAGAVAYPGDLDPGFSDDGKVVTGFGDDDRAEALAVQPDGKVIAAGTGGPGFDFAIARYRADGSLDPSFSGDGKALIDLGEIDRATSIALQPDGKIVVAGWRLDFVGVMVRLRADGSLDPTFSGDGKVTLPWIPTALALQPDGRILVAGVGGAVWGFGLARYTTDGSLDPSLSGDGQAITDIGEWDEPASIALRPDGKIVLGGSTGERDSSNDDDFALTRLDADGSLDPGFGDEGIVTTQFGLGGEQIRAVRIKSDGTIVAAGGADIEHPQPGGGIATLDHFAIAQYTPAGVLDPGFGAGGKVVGSEADPEAAAFQANGKVVVGQSSFGDFVVSRFHANGATDTGFLADGLGSTTTDFGGTRDTLYDVAVAPDGKIVGAGKTAASIDAPGDFAITRYRGGEGQGAGGGGPESSSGEFASLRLTKARRKKTRVRVGVRVRDGEPGLVEVKGKRRGRTKRFRVTGQGSAYEARGRLRRGGWRLIAEFHPAGSWESESVCRRVKLKGQARKWRRLRLGSFC